MLLHIFALWSAGRFQNRISLWLWHEESIRPSRKHAPYPRAHAPVYRCIKLGLALLLDKGLQTSDPSVFSIIYDYVMQTDCSSALDDLHVGDDCLVVGQYCL
jgi:hypothetical protein